MYRTFGHADGLSRRAQRTASTLIPRAPSEVHRNISSAISCCRAPTLGPSTSGVGSRGRRRRGRSPSYIFAAVAFSGTSSGQAVKDSQPAAMVRTFSCKRRMRFRASARFFPRAAASRRWCANPISSTRAHRVSAASGSWPSGSAMMARMASRMSGLAPKHTKQVAMQAAAHQALLCAEHLTSCALHRPDLCEPIFITLPNATTARDL